MARHDLAALAIREPVAELGVELPQSETTTSAAEPASAPRPPRAISAKRAGSSQTCGSVG